MRSRSSKLKFLNTYFNKDIEFRNQIYNLLSFMGMIGGFGVAVIAAVIKESIATVIINFMLSVFSFIMLRLAEKRKCYDLCGWIMITLIFFMAFPILFFYCGGYKSGSASFFILAIIFSAFLLDKYKRIAVIIFEFILYISCCFVSYYKPEMIAVLLSDFNIFFSVTMNFVTACSFLLIAVMFRAHLLISKQTEIEELNRELKARNETLAQFDQVKSDFLATVAHEINTPLAVIAASSGDTLDLLKESPLNKDEIKENQLVIEKKVKLIDTIILDLMDIVAIETGRLSLNPQLADLSGLLENICASQHKQMDLNNNKIVYDFQPALPKIYIDPYRIEQVMINLLSNAYYHTKNGIITLKLVRKDNCQVVSVTDNGEGMDPETLQMIFNRHISTRTDYWRHGIGLYICGRIISAHGSDIWIESEKGLGTTVYFSLKEEAVL